MRTITPRTLAQSKTAAFSANTAKPTFEEYLKWRQAKLEQRKPEDGVALLLTEKQAMPRSRDVDWGAKEVIANLQTARDGADFREQLLQPLEELMDSAYRAEYRLFVNKWEIAGLEQQKKNGNLQGVFRELSELKSAQPKLADEVRDAYGLVIRSSLDSAVAKTFDQESRGFLTNFSKAIDAEIKGRGRK